jgi:hypothetical protein
VYGAVPIRGDAPDGAAHAGDRTTAGHLPTASEGTGTNVRTTPAPGVTSRILENGHLEIVVDGSGRSRQWGRVSAAVWIALRQHRGQCVDAADMLADLWNIDRINMRTEVEIRVEEWCDAGLMRRQHD